MKNSFSFIIISLFFFLQLLLISCSNEGNADPISSNFGEFVQAPNFDETQISSDFIATNTGLYFKISSTNSSDDQICRYDLDQNNILDGTWQNYIYNPTSGVDYIERVTPINFFAEATSEHQIFIMPQYYAFDTPVYQTTNMANGSNVGQENAPTHDFNPSNMGSYGKIIKEDNGQDWAVFRGGLVSNSDQHVVKKRTGGQNFSEVCTITAEGELYFTASLLSNDLLALSYEQKKLYIIKATGQVVECNLAAYYDQMMAGLNFKFKFRFSSAGTFFLFQNKVMKLDGNLTVAPFYTIPYVGGLSGDFCVDNEYLFATDGTRKELGGFLNEINLIPNPPSTTNQEVLLEYIEKTNFFKIGSLETSTNPDDKYIYVLGVDGRILIISKYYY